MHRNLLLSLSTLLLAGLSVQGVQAQGQMRGEENFEAAQRSVEMVLIVEEIEEAGFVLDVEEGFDEEWEEGIYVESDDDLAVTRLNEDDAHLLDIDDMSAFEDVLETDEQGFEDADAAADEAAEFETSLDATLEEELESEDIFALGLEEEVDESGAWWEEDDRDDSWDDLEDEWELEDMEESYEEEDMETLEALYERG